MASVYLGVSRFMNRRATKRYNEAPNDIFIIAEYYSLERRVALSQNSAGIKLRHTKTI
jgi:hypothetical protein